jgi:pantoate--beta-alanine ligase
VQLIEQAAAFARSMDSERACGRRIGLVPTMGALHSGHISLVERAAAECDVVAVTLFVNPLQFDDPSDLASYPRDLASDLEKASAAGSSVVFAPSVGEMYPGHPALPSTSVHVAGLGDRLEGASRPGHFDGVATVVTKLFALAGRCSAYFGEKDFQQLTVVRALVGDLCLPVEVVGCPTVREHDGLALSSRNLRLGPAERRAATSLHRALALGLRMLSDGERDLDAVGSVMRREMAQEPLVVCDYAEVVDVGTLRRPAATEGELRLLVAATVGGVRLIDNEGIVVGPVKGSRDTARAVAGAPSRPAPGREN